MQQNRCTADETGVKAAPITKSLQLLRSNACPICAQAMHKVIDLPRLPLTEKYEPWAATFEVGRGFLDQALLFCERCTHGKLEVVVSPAELYGGGYRTATATSASAMRAVGTFANFVKQAPLERVETVIDIGGNDASLLANFPGKKHVIVDPNASGDAWLVREFVEAADLAPFKPDRKLILSSHTLEHIPDPQAFFEKVSSIFTYDDLLAIQVPSLERLVLDRRIDQIHHQHVHYYTQRSLGLLLNRFGFEVIGVQVDPEHWGAVMVLCRRGQTPDSAKRLTYRIVEASAGWHKSWMRHHNVPDRAIAFGAALMLPMLAYWMPSLQDIEYVADNDRGKDGLRFVNFNKRIRVDYDLAGRDVVISAIWTKLAARALTAQAIEKGARSVIVPLRTL